MVTIVRADIEKEYNLRDDEVAVRIREQVGETIIVDLIPPTPRPLQWMTPITRQVIKPCNCMIAFGVPEARM